MSPSQLLHFAIVWLSFICICTTVAQIDDEDRLAAIDPAALARYRMYAYGNLLKRSAEGHLGTPAKLSLFTDKRRADGRGNAGLQPGSIRSFSGTPKFSSKNCFFSPVQCSFYYRR